MLLGNLNKESDIVKESVFCPLPFNKLILASWGEVSMCCYQLTQLGRLDENTSIMDIWNSPLAKSIRDKTRLNELHPVCKSSNNCPFIVEEPIPHPLTMYRRAAYPTHIEICLPDKHCNIGGENPTEDNPACIMCKRNFDIPNQPDITEFLCEKVKPLMPYLLQLSVLGIAEPFWKDAVFKIFERLEFERYKEQVLFTTNTNGICLNERVANKFFESTVKSDISWSLDSATPITHMKIRRLDAFDLVVSNLKRWIKIREEFGGSSFHKICIHNNINMINVHEMTQMVELAHDLGVERMIMLPTYDQGGVVKLGELLLGPKNVKIFTKYSREAMERSKKLGIKLQYPKSFEKTEQVKELVQLDLTP